MKILSASLMGALDPFGRTYSNHPTLQAVVDKFIPVEDFRYEYHEPGLFLGECDGWYMYHHHNGDGRNHGGYSGRRFHITMKDGTERDLDGPWSGGEYSVWRDAGVKLVNIDLREKDSIYTTYVFGYATSIDKVVNEILPLVRPVGGQGASLFSASLITSDPQSPDERWQTDFCITKGKPRHLIDHEVLRQWR